MKIVKILSLFKLRSMCQLLYVYMFWFPFQFHAF